MEKKQNDRHNLYKMTGSKMYTAVSVLLVMTMMLSSCSVVEGIFKAGMGVGIFAVLAILVVIVFVISRFRKK